MASSNGSLAIAATPEDELIHFKGGFVANRRVWAMLIDLEAQGARFELVEPDRFRVIPASLLTTNIKLFLRIHRDECRRLLEYGADAQERM